MTIKEVLDRISDDTGWNTRTQLDLLASFINEKGLDKECERFLKAVALEEADEDEDEEAVD